MATQATQEKETRAFQTEVRQLLDLMIHSLYSNKEVFLRELISNASDAQDKLRFEALGNDALYGGDPNMEIRIRLDKEARTLTLSDNGIGMSREEVIANIGTIAQSGTRKFLESLTGDQAKDANLIGQFGVGFYSSFIVADKVTLHTRRAGSSPEEGVRWESKGDGEYTLEQVAKPTRGTEVTLHLRTGEEQDPFLSDWQVRSIIHKFSDHISWPILMPAEKGADKEEGGEEGKEESWEKINRASALWTRPKSDITAEEYAEFYKHVGHDFEDPLAHHHARLEGKYEYTVLLYLPKRPPFDLWDREQRHGVRLYVRRVFIMEGKQELLPRYLRFVRGVIDSTDLPLNVSREILQQSPVVNAIRKGAVGKVFTMMEELASKEPEKYQEFWKNFGSVLKEGIIEDMENQERLAKLLRFSSTHEPAPEQKVTLADYVSRMKEGQKKIYFVTGETLTATRSSPHLEIFRKKDIEVLLLHDRIDEWLVSHLTEFDGKPLQSIARGELDLGDLEEKEEKEEINKEEGAFADLLQKVKETLEDQVKEVRLSHRLTDSPSCLVGGAYDMSPAMERILKAAGQDAPVSKRTLELNPHHPLVLRMKGEGDPERVKDWCHLLHDQALLSEGGQLVDPAAFVRRMNQMLLG